MHVANISKLYLRPVLIVLYYYIYKGRERERDGSSLLIFITIGLRYNYYIFLFDFNQIAIIPCNYSPDANISIFTRKSRGGFVVHEQEESHATRLSLSLSTIFLQFKHVLFENFGLNGGRRDVKMSRGPFSRRHVLNTALFAMRGKVDGDLHKNCLPREFILDSGRLNNSDRPCCRAPGSYAYHVAYAVNYREV